MNLNKLKGTGVALVTPFHKDGSIDFKSFRKIIDVLTARLNTWYHLVQPVKQQL